MQTQPAENIEAVLGRFQAWAGTQSAHKSSRGIRELSYEEALGSSRYRWPGASRPSAKKKQSPEAPSSKVETRVAAQPRRKAQPRAKAAAKDCARPVFREVLEEAANPAPIKATAHAQPLDLGRQVAISIRLAPAERALIKARAAESGITASAYIRQCALEVEQLRAEVRDALARIERGNEVPLSQPTTSIFTRWFRRIFRPRSPSLALRI